MTVVLDPVSVSASVPEDLVPVVHWSDPPYTHGLCGTLLRGVDEDREPNCVVCVDLVGRA